MWNLDKIIWIPQPLLEDDDIRKGPIDELADGTLVWPGSFAAHADEYCRFVGEDTVLLAEVTDEEAAESPVSAENKRRIDAAYEILKNETLPDGRPLKIVRMPFPEHLIFRGSQDNPTVMGWKQFFDENGGVAFDGTPWPRATTASSTPAATATSSCATTWCWASATGTRAWIRRSRRRTSAPRRCSRACSPAARSSCWTRTA